MASGRWQDSERKSRLPANWESLRKQVHRRDRSRCQVRLTNGKPCGEPAVDVDHIRAGDDHRLENLRCICDWHHKQKSAREGAMAYNAKMARSRKKFRREEKHPGLL
jgi:5-methylcytosine-specific restriction protein A